MKAGGLILVVDDEVQIRRFLKISLESCGYQVIVTERGKDGVSLVATENPDVIILDLGLPDMDGLDFVSRVREWSKTPIIVLTVRDSEKDKVTLLNSGADDYLTKPFGLNELKARISVAFRHKNTLINSAVFHLGRLYIDFSMRLVKMDDKQVKFTPKEYAVLSLLARNAGKVLTQSYILREIWGPHSQEESQYLRIYVMQIRRKIEIDSSNPLIILTEPGVGYRFVSEEM